MPMTMHESQPNANTPIAVFRLNATVFSSSAIRRSCASFFAASAASMASTFVCHFPNGEAANSSGGSAYPGPQSTRPRPGRPPGMMTPRGGGGNESHAAGEAGSLGGGAGIGLRAGGDEGDGLVCGAGLIGSKDTGDA